MSRRKPIISLILWAAMIALLFAAIDERVRVTHYTVEMEKITAPVRLAVLTDFHGCSYGPDGADLVALVAAQEPHAILLVGDMFSADGNPDMELAMFAALNAVAPAYYVTGNHEFWEYDVPTLMEQIAATGVTVLASSGVTVEFNGQRVNLCGIHDSVGMKTMGEPSTPRRIAAATKHADPDACTILLAHRPELIDMYAQAGTVDLVVCGHAHGGQVRIPGLLDGLYAPNQGWFPTYTGGRYDVDGVTMILSRGLSRYRLPPRVFNPPEVVLVTLE